MKQIKNHEVNTSSWTRPGEINFILLNPTPNEISSSRAKSNFRSGLDDIYKNNPEGNLLLPFIGSFREEV